MEAPVTVLIARAERADREALEALLHDQGYRVHSCGGSEQACSLFDEVHPEVVFLGASLAAADDCRLLREAKLHAEQEFVPVVILGDGEEPELLELCARCGADDFLLRPYLAPIVRTKIDTLVKDRRLHAQLREQHRELQYHQGMLQRDLKIAENIFTSVTRQNPIDLPNVSYFLSPMGIASGDLILQARKPGGTQRLLLGDFTGHGLTAAIGALPVAEVFGSMTTMGFPVEDMLTVMNRRLRELLPTGLFLAMAVVEFSPARMELRAWNAGLPDLLLIRGDCGLERLESRLLPLAVLDNDPGGREPRIFQVAEGDRVYLYSDGVIEAGNRAGDPFGQESLEALLCQSPGEGGMVATVRRALTAYTEKRPQEDDITFIELVCRGEE